MDVIRNGLLPPEGLERTSTTGTTPGMRSKILPIH